MQKYEFIDHTADAGLVVYGASRKDIFINAAIGMFSLITDSKEVADIEKYEIAVDADDYEELLVTWLNELLYLFDAENLVFSRFEIIRLNHDSLVAVAFGEAIDFSRHEIKTAIKAATYHQLNFTRSDTGFSAQVILDV